MKKAIQVILLILAISKTATAQTTATFQPDGVTGIDALIKSDYLNAGTNFGNDPEFDAVAWKVSGTNVIIRSLLKFDLSSIPAGNGIFNTTLTLFFDSAAVYGGGSHSGINSICMRKITSPWQENTVTWNNQPTTSTTDQMVFNSVSGSSSLSFTGPLSYFSNWVADWVTNPSTNYGVMIQLQLEVPNACRLYASSDFPLPSKRPKLEVSHAACPVSSTITAVGSLTHCDNETDTLFGPSGPGYTYVWKKNGVVISGAISKDLIISSPGAGTWAYTCSITMGGCTVTSNTITAVYSAINQLPAITITTPGNVTSLCQGSLAITATAGYAKYRWSNGASVVQESASNIYTAGQAGNYSCTAYQGAGCDIANSNSILLTGVIVSKTISASPASLPCNGGTSTLSISSTPGAYYQWYIYNTPLPYQAYTTYNASFTGDYAVDITAPGCPTIKSGSYILTGGSNISYSFPALSCSGSILHGTPNALSYQWKYMGNDILGANSSTYLATQYGQYSCLINTIACGSNLATFPAFIGGTSSATPFITTDPPGVFGVTGVNVPACSTTSLVAYPPGLAYTWHTPWGVFSGGQSIVTTMSGIYTCDILYSCTTGSNNATVNVIPGSPVPVTVTYSNCNQTTLGVSSNIRFFQWRKNGIAIPGATSSGYAATSPGYYSCLVSNGCGDQLSDSVLVTVPPSVVIAPSGPTTFCTGGSVLLKLPPVVSGSSYKWFLNNVQIGVDTVMMATASGTYRVEVSNGSCVAKDSIVVTVNSPPSSVITPSGNLTFCSGDSVILNATTGIGYAYQWLKNGVNISGATSSAYTAKASGSYTVLVTATCGVVSSPVTVTVNAKPAPVITASGPLTFCNGDSVIFTTSNTAGSTYFWKKNGVVIAGATSFKYTAKTAGTYKVVKTNVYGCSGTSAGKNVVINTPVATITPLGPTSFCIGDSVVLMAPNTAGYSYQWKKFNNNIAGATALNYAAKTQGTYKVLVTNSGGCTKISSGVNVTVPCREGDPDNDGSMELSLFPNPFSGNFILDVSGIKDGTTWDAEIYDVTGKLVEKRRSNTKSLTAGEQLVPGVYEIVVKTGEEIKRIRAVKGEE